MGSVAPDSAGRAGADGDAADPTNSLRLAHLAG